MRKLAPYFHLLYIVIFIALLLSLSGPKAVKAQAINCVDDERPNATGLTGTCMVHPDGYLLFDTCDPPGEIIKESECPSYSGDPAYDKACCLAGYECTDEVPLCSPSATNCQRIDESQSSCTQTVCSAGLSRCLELTEVRDPSYSYSCCNVDQNDCLITGELCRYSSGARAGSCCSDLSCTAFDPISNQTYCEPAAVFTQPDCFGVTTGKRGECSFAFCNPLNSYEDGKNPPDSVCSYFYRCCIPYPPSHKPDYEALNPTCSTGGSSGINTAIGCISVGSATSFAIFFLNFGTGTAGGVALILIVYSGILIITSGGNRDQLKRGKELLTAALGGLLLIIFSVFLLEFFGVRILMLPGL